MVLLCVTIKNVCIDSRCILQFEYYKGTAFKIGKTTTNNHLKAKIQLDETFTEATFSIHEDKYKEKKNGNPESCKKNPTDLSFKPTPRFLLFFKMNSRQEYHSKLSFYSQNYN